ncbi:hypothetical protein, conserved [Angomonas deanei]|uniref:Uncharacterized protein n=1 Tax=Angomonas deanei TaxID=59799 RepID=A0A7G2C991_9TRYP|nr:hypothetical protein, conserved [Angomonas deanei]
MVGQLTAVSWELWHKQARGSDDCGVYMTLAFLFDSLSMSYQTPLPRATVAKFRQLFTKALGNKAVDLLTECKKLLSPSKPTVPIHGGAPDVPEVNPFAAHIDEVRRIADKEHRKFCRHQVTYNLIGRALIRMATGGRTGIGYVDRILSLPKEPQGDDGSSLWKFLETKDVTLRTQHPPRSGSNEVRVTKESSKPEVMLRRAASGGVSFPKLTLDEFVLNRHHYRFWAGATVDADGCYRLSTVREECVVGLYCPSYWKDHKDRQYIIQSQYSRGIKFA